MNKGQMFSVDFLLSIAMLILFIGLLMAAAEIKGYEAKEKILSNSLEQKTEVALGILMNSPDVGCTFNGEVLSSSINTTKLTTITLAQLKTKLNLQDNNVSIVLDGIEVMGDTMDSKNIVALDSEVLICSGNVSFSDLNSCMTQTVCPLPKQTISIKVGK